MSAPFVHLRLRTRYSFGKGMLSPEQIAKRCREYRMPAVAMTDEVNLAGGQIFCQTLKNKGIQPIVGCLMPLILNAKDKTHPSVLLLAATPRGLKNLIRLSSQAYLKFQGEGLPWEALKACTQDLILLTGGNTGPLEHILSQGGNPLPLLQQFQEAFSHRLYLELSRHGLPQEQKYHRALLKLSHRYRLPLVATNDCYFDTKEQREAHDVLMRITQKKVLTDPTRVMLNDSFAFRPPEDMKALFSDLPDAVENTLLIAKRCAALFETRAPSLPLFKTPKQETQETLLRTKAATGLKKKSLPKNKVQLYQKRLEEELDIICSLKFAGYFLIVADIVNWARQQKIPVGPGRGSGASSLVAWCLGITDVDPLQFHLVFERFLNPKRVSWPDFDIDFCPYRRPEILEYVRKQYGEDKVAQIITFGKLQAKMAIRDVGRVLSMPYAQVDALSKRIPFMPINPKPFQEILKDEPVLQEQKRNDPTVKKLFEIIIRLEGLYRHPSIHAAGLVISNKPLMETVPLYKDPKSAMAATQFSMKDVEQAGLIKFDFLGLKTLTVIHNTWEMIRRNYGTVPAMDKKKASPLVMALMNKGDTTGVFQFESEGMRELLIEAKPNNIEDLIALVSLYRPGPMENIPNYIKAKNGKAIPPLLHESITPITKDTYGIIIYQEQVLQIAQVFAGFSLSQADLLRRAMGKKDSQEMALQRQEFIKGAQNLHKVSAQLATKVFDKIEKFAGYGFNKAHGASYALIAYETAWLKTYYPCEFAASAMALDRDKPEKLLLYREELKKRGIPLISPCVNTSDVTFSVQQQNEKKSVLFGLCDIKNVSELTVKNLVQNRKEHGSFKNLADFLRRTQGVTKRQLEHLIIAGALDCLDPNRATLYHNLPRLIEVAKQLANTQGGLFEPSDINVTDLLTTPATPWSRREAIVREYTACDLTFLPHPLEGQEPLLKRLGLSPFFHNIGRGSGKRQKVPVVVLQKEKGIGKKGAPYSLLKLMDFGKVFTLILSGNKQTSFQDTLKTGALVIVEMEKQTGYIHCFSTINFQDFYAQHSTQLWVNITSTEDLNILFNAYKNHRLLEKNGQCHLTLIFKDTPIKGSLTLPGLLSYKIENALLGLTFGFTA